MFKHLNPFQQTLKEMSVILVEKDNFSSGEVYYIFRYKKVVSHLTCVHTRKYTTINYYTVHTD